MCPPFLLFLNDSEEVRLFSSTPQLESEIEGIDIINGEYEAYDALGQRLDLFVDLRGVPRSSPGRADAEKARQKIVKFYSNTNPAFQSTMSLAELVCALCDLYRYDTRRIEWMKGPER